MTNGRRMGLNLGYGDWHDPRCRLQCRGSERNRIDSPARFGRDQSGRKLVFCPCCDHELRQAKPGETGLSPGTQVQLASLTPDVAARARMFVDDICGYDVLVLKELRAVGDPEVTPRT
jgi:hypothetical protein